MASTTSSTPEVLQKNAILEQGFFCVEDHIVGEGVDEFARKGLPFRTEEGLEFCKRYALDDKRIQDALDSCFDSYGLGLFKALGPTPNNAFSFFTRTEGEAKAKALIVQLWGTDSRFTIYSDSHLYPLHWTQAANGLLETPPALLHAGIKPIEVYMKYGGLSILDGRLRFTIVRGKGVMFGFATLDELRHWRKMELPNAETLKRKVMNMQGTKAFLNFEFTG